jgi:hypothetical protein
MKAAALLMAFSCAWLTGCATAPFPNPEPFSAAGVEPAAIPARFAERLAPRFEQVNAVVFRFWGREMAAMGMVSVDRPARSFAVACLTPIGVKLFDVVCEQGRIEGRVALPELEKRGGNLAQAAGADLARAYFDWSPPEGSPHKMQKGRLVFSAKDATGTTDYCYAWGDGRLAEKIRRERGHVSWKVEYRAYQEKDEGLVPSGMVIANRHYGYRLVVSAREVRR